MKRRRNIPQLKRLWSIDALYRVPFLASLLKMLAGNMVVKFPVVPLEGRK